MLFFQTSGVKKKNPVVLIPKNTLDAHVVKDKQMKDRGSNQREVGIKSKERKK